MLSDRGIGSIHVHWAAERMTAGTRHNRLKAVDDNGNGAAIDHNEMGAKHFRGWCQQRQAARKIVEYMTWVKHGPFFSFKSCHRGPPMVIKFRDKIDIVLQNDEPLRSGISPFL